MQVWLRCALLALAACHNAATDAEQQDLADETFSIASAYESTMCACKTAACADDLDRRFQAWLGQMGKKVADSDKRSPYAATIGDEGVQKLDRIVADYEGCRDKLQIRRAIGR